MKQRGVPHRTPGLRTWFAGTADRRIDNVKRLTFRVGVESLTKLDSDLTAAEALQEAETEVGLAGSE